MLHQRTEQLAVGGWKTQGVEIWDIKTRKPIKRLTDNYGGIQCSASTNNILAFGTWNREFQLFDVRNWESIHSQKLALRPWSMHLTINSKYLTIGGFHGEKCVVMEIK